MMPIFFHAESHLWIAYLFFCNGLLIHFLLRSYSAGYFELTKPIEAQVLAAFFISISLNGLFLLGLGVLNLPFTWMRQVLPCISTLLLISVFLSKARLLRAVSCDFNIWRAAGYLVVFVLLFYNGGLIEQASDAWWHMSYANKLNLANSLSVEVGHLNGVSHRYYPPLWHGNLALATSMSDISLPVFWNSFTAWGAVIKVMGFYLFALSLTRSVMVATLSSLLFVLLPGMGVSYLRVSAWPSHIAYTAFFTLFYVGFSYLDTFKSIINDRVSILRQPAIILVVLSLVCIINFSHQVELVWFFAGLLFYVVGVCVVDIIMPDRTHPIEPKKFIIQLGMSLVLILTITAGLWRLVEGWGSIHKSHDLMIANIFPVAFFSFIIFTLARRFFYAVDHRNNLEVLVLVAFGILLALLVDGRQLMSLFKPELAYPTSTYGEYPVAALGFFGHQLSLPGWHLQLRSGLLFSGVLSIPIAIGLACWKTNRATVFLASTASLSFLFLVSPYLHDWLVRILNYNSAYRISILIFHPIILALLLQLCWKELVTGARHE